MADTVFANHIDPTWHGRLAAFHDGGLDGFRLAAPQPVVVGEVGETVGTLGIGAMADRAVGGEQATTHLQGLRILSHFLYRHGSELGEERAVLLVGTVHFTFPFLHLGPAIFVAGQDALPVAQARIKDQVTEGEYHGADEQHEPPARQRVVVFLDAVIGMADGFFSAFVALALASRQQQPDQGCNGPQTQQGDVPTPKRGHLFLTPGHFFITLLGIGLVCEGQVGGFIEAFLAFAAIGPEHDANKGDDDQNSAQTAESPDIHGALPFVGECSAKDLQVGHHGIHFGLALYRVPRTGDVFVGVRHAQGAQGIHFLGSVPTVEGVFHQPRVRRHLRFRHYVTRVVQVRTMPVIGVASTDTGQVRTGTLGTPQERVVVNAFTCNRVMAVALGFGAERPDHLRVATYTAFTDVEVATFQLQRGVGLHALDRLVDHILEEQRDDLSQATDAHREDHEQGQQTDVLFHYFVILHYSAPQAICAAALYSAALA